MPPTEVSVLPLLTPVTPTSVPVTDAVVVRFMELVTTALTPLAAVWRSLAQAERVPLPVSSAAWTWQAVRQKMQPWESS